jgi:hypothetical protein
MNANLSFKYPNYLFTIVGIVIVLTNISCRDEGHHLLEDVTKKIRHEDDTIGWSQTLRGLHGIWVNRKYLSYLNDNVSIYGANQLLPNTFSVINIDARRFISDSLEFVALNANDSRNWKSCVYFGKQGQQTYMEITTQHPVFSDSGLVMSFALDTMEFETHLTLTQDYLEGQSNRERFVKISNDVSDKEYENYPLIGIEIYMRKFLAGNYDVYDADNTLLMSNIVFHEDGTIGNHPFAKYRMLPWAGFDALMIQGMTFKEEQLNANNRYYGLRVKNESLELYRITTNRKKAVIMGELELVLKK